MPSPQELEQKFWDSIKSDMTVMLGVEDAEDGHFRPMTAIAEHETRGPLWFFTATDTAIPPVLKGGTKRAMIAYSAKGHDLFATLHGTTGSGARSSPHGSRAARKTRNSRCSASSPRAAKSG
jgi:general stress protein 26